MADITLTVDPGNPTEGDIVEITVTDESVTSATVEVNIGPRFKGDTNINKTITLNREGTTDKFTNTWNTAGYASDQYIVTYSQQTPSGSTNDIQRMITIIPKQISQPDNHVALQRTETHPTKDQPLWVAIRNRTNAVGHDKYQEFINTVFDINEVRISFDSKIKSYLKNQPADLKLNIHGPYAYSVLKMATQIFLTLESGIIINNDFDENEESFRLNNRSNPAANLKENLKNQLVQYLGGNSTTTLPYLDRIIESFICVCPHDTIPPEVLPFSCGILQYRFTRPSMIELIWSYWHEEGMLAQTMNAIAMRFQNQSVLRNDPLAELELDPLRPLNNLIWGYVQDEHNRLTVRRRALEYDHQYGFRLQGRAVPAVMPADSRSKFIEAFHNLLYRTALFYREDADTTVIADAFPLLNALKDVHMILAEGAHNQYGDLPWTSRAEMLTEQWILARPEMKEFLRGRYMVPYQEPWMGAVDSMKRLMSWGDVTVSHFNELAVDGERLLLSIRFGDWSDLNNTEQQARNWARYWKPEIQRYLHGYLAVTGVDLMADITDSREASIRYMQPSSLLLQRLSEQSRKPLRELPGYTGGMSRIPGPSRASVSFRRPEYTEMTGKEYNP